jgi:hypothetical protein
MALPDGFHLIMLLKSWISCSSAHGSLSSSSCDCAAPASWGVLGCVSPSGVEAALAFAFLRGGILRKNGVEISEEGEVKTTLVAMVGEAASCRYMTEGARVRVGLNERKVWRVMPLSNPHLHMHRHG